MLESGAMPQEEVVAGKSSLEKSPLDKPLQQLTEDDIAQLTREDCRRYLKEKGMRRPSWNKSQAIQQVIMLKTLLETTADCDADFRKKLRISRPNKLHANHTVPENVPQETPGDVENSVQAEDMAPYRRKDLDKNDISCGFSVRFAAANNGSALPRTTVSTHMPVGQMTIFYSGKVNVFDDVPADKARAIMHVAASPLRFPQEQPLDGTILVQPSPLLSKAASAKACPDSTVIHLPTPQTVSSGKTNDNSRGLGEESNIFREENPVEGPSTRKASVQRYLEKRKDRFKSKRKAGVTSCTSLDVYFNHNMGNQLSNEPLSGSDTCSPPQIRLPSTLKRCSSADNEFVKNVCASSSMNNKGL